VKALPASGYILTGTTTNGVNGSDVYVVKINENGDTLWTRTFGGSKDDEGAFVEVCADSGYVICGDTKSTLIGKSEVYLLRMDTMGNAGCSWSHINTFVSKPDSVMYGVATSQGDYGASVGMAPFSTGRVTLQKTDGCAVFGIHEVSSPELLIQIYPNPVSDLFEIHGENELGSVRIYDCVGNICYEEKSCSNAAKINMLRYVPGLYLVEAAGRHFRVIKQ
jgi:hypothetical protein